MKKIKLVFVFELLVGAVLVLFILYASIKEKMEVGQIQSYIANLESDAKKFEKDNFQLQKKIDYYQTTDYIKKTAKESLNQQEVGEGVAVINDRLENESYGEVPPEEEQEAEKIVFPEDPNYLKWWKYFFEK